MAQTVKECADIALAAKEKNVKVLVCHVLRYTSFFEKINLKDTDELVKRYLKNEVGC